MNVGTIKLLWISAEHWAENQWTPDDDIVDIKVTLQDETCWIATVCSFQHVNTLKLKWSESGECLSGRYLWAANLILAADTSRSTIETMLQNLLVNDEFRYALAPVES